MTNAGSSNEAACTVTQLTPTSRGAVATLSVEGPLAMRCAATHFTAASGKPLESLPLGRIVFGHWRNASGTEEEVVLCPRGAHCIEVNCHGGLAASQAIRESLIAAGASEMTTEDWTRTHYQDPLSAEARRALAEAKTERTAAILLDQYRGALRRAITATIKDLSAGQLPSAAQRLLRLHALGPLGAHLTQPWRIVIAGPPNAGKSSLVNRIVGYQRAIVYDQPGTTRDLLSAYSALDGWPVELIDTAGLRIGTDAIESEGVARAEAAASQADLVLLVFDSCLGWSAVHDQLVLRFPHALIVANKCDLPASQALSVDAARVSAVTGAGMSELLTTVTRELCADPPKPGEAVPFALYHLHAIATASQALAREEPDQASRILSRDFGRGS